jgi:hypothetical protein
MEQVGTGEVGSVSCVGSPNGQKLKEHRAIYKTEKPRNEH